MANVCPRALFGVRTLDKICIRLISQRTLGSSWQLANLPSFVETQRKQVYGASPALIQKRFFQPHDVYEPSPNAPRPGRKDYEERVWKAINTFDRFPKEKKLTLETHFINDLGLDSLDHVELIVALETEFNCEIPDDDAEKLMTPKQMLDYLCVKDKVPEKRTEYGQQDFKKI